MEHTNELLQRIVFEPAGGAAPKASVIWLHGLGASGNDFAPVAQHMQPHMPVPTRFILPHAPVMPVTINGGMPMPAWYDIKTLERPANSKWSTLEASAQNIIALIHKEVAAGVQKIVLAGFSQGSALSLHIALRCAGALPCKLSGVVALSGYIIEDEAAPLPSPLPSVPLFLAHGTEDEVVAFKLAQRALQHLEAGGITPTFKQYAMGHSVCEPELADIQTFLVDVLG